MKTQDIQYPINEYFVSVQGEGALQGRVALFIRFGLCNLKCSFCDTKKALSKYKEYSFTQIEEILEKYRAQTQFLILTGGEPLLHNLEDLCGIAKKMKYWIAVETNGTLYQKWVKHVDYITVSPKRGEELNKKMIKQANELKFVIESQKDIDFAETFMPFLPTYLMPCNNKKNKAKLILDYLKKSPFHQFMHLGVQMHKVYKIV